MFINFSAFPAVCDPPCQNYGVCVAPNSCDCPPGYPGVGCSGTNVLKMLVLLLLLIISLTRLRDHEQRGFSCTRRHVMTKKTRTLSIDTYNKCGIHIVNIVHSIRFLQTEYKVVKDLRKTCKSTLRFHGKIKPPDFIYVCMCFICVCR